MSALQIDDNRVIETFAICRLYRFHWTWSSI